jgi:hypothetical protein
MQLSLAGSLQSGQSRGTVQSGGSFELRHCQASLQWQFAICQAVREEAKKLRDPATGEMVPVNVASLIESGVLQLLELASEAEQTMDVEQAIAGDDGEAMCIALAASRAWNWRSMARGDQPRGTLPPGDEVLDHSRHPAPLGRKGWRVRRTDARIDSLDSNARPLLSAGVASALTMVGGAALMCAEGSVQG